MQSPRDAFGETLCELGTEDPNLLVVSTDMLTPTRANKFAEMFPDRVIKVGIAEANAIGIISGLAEHGFNIVWPCFASFMTGRYDQIRCSLSYSQIGNVTLVGTHSGMAIGKDGVTQMGLEDINIMRALPDIHIYQPGSPAQTKLLTRKAIENTTNLTYLRIGRQPVPEFPATQDYYNLLRTGGDKSDVIICSGPIWPEAFQAAQELDIDCYHIAELKPFPSGLIRRLATEHKRMWSVEDHSIHGGLGTLIAEQIAEFGCGTRLTRLGIRIWPRSGKPEDLYRAFGLHAESIVRKIKTAQEIE